MTADRAGEVTSNERAEREWIVVIGASMGGVQALRQIAADLPADFPAPVLMVLHIGRHQSVLPGLLKPKHGRQAVHAFHGASLERGQILIAPPDRHMLVERGRIRLSHGPKEHFSRPAIDPLFRSVALSHGSGAIGIILTGGLDDGTAGLQAIKACGGIAVVQDPSEALEPSMPLSALRHVVVDHNVPLRRIVEVCASIVAQPPPPPQAPIPADLRHEHNLAMNDGEPMAHLPAIAKPSTFVCPDCHGALWELNDVAPMRFRCHTGHAYTLRTLQHAQSQATDESLWSAFRALQEQKLLLEKGIESGALTAHDDNLRSAVTRLESDAVTLRQLIERHQAPDET